MKPEHAARIEALLALPEAARSATRSCAGVPLAKCSSVRPQRHEHCSRCGQCIVATRQRGTLITCQASTAQSPVALR